MAERYFLGTYVLTCCLLCLSGGQAFALWRVAPIKAPVVLGNSGALSGAALGSRIGDLQQGTNISLRSILPNGGNLLGLSFPHITGLPPNPSQKRAAILTSAAQPLPASRNGKTAGVKTSADAMGSLFFRGPSDGSKKQSVLGGLSAQMTEVRSAMGAGNISGGENALARIFSGRDARSAAVLADQGALFGSKSEISFDPGPMEKLWGKNQLKEVSPKGNRKYLRKIAAGFIGSWNLSQITSLVSDHPSALSEIKKMHRRSAFAQIQFEVTVNDASGLHLQANLRKSRWKKTRKVVTGLEEHSADYDGQRLSSLYFNDSSYNNGFETYYDFVLINKNKLLIKYGTVIDGDLGFFLYERQPE
ncbi:hypothetical protein ACFL2T_04620 [Elusimicrobiota bacterium]